MHIKVMLEYFYPWTNSAGIYLARQKGWYKDAGLDVECLCADPCRGDSLNYLANKEVDFAVFPSGRLMVRVEQGHNVRGVAAINHTGLECIQTIKSTGITRPRDLVGKRVALNPTIRGMAMLRHIVAADGGDPDKINVYNSAVRELVPEDIQSGMVDATFGSYWVWETLMDSNVSRDQRIIWPVEKVGAPKFHSYFLGTHADTIKNNPQLVQTFLNVTQRGYLEVIKDPQSAVSIYESVIPYFPHNLFERSLPLVASTWTHNGNWGQMRQELLQGYTKWQAQNGIVADPQVWQRAVDTQFFPEN